MVGAEEVDEEMEEEESVESKRARLNVNKVINAEKMIKKHDHKRNKVTRCFKLNDIVSVKIPRIDRTGTDFLRLPGILCKISSENADFYRILTPGGILADKYHVSDLEPYSGVVDVILDENYETNCNSKG